MSFLNKEDKTPNAKEILAAMDPAEILTPNRSEDEGDDLWKVFLTIQERIMNGFYER